MNTAPVLSLDAFTGADGNTRWGVVMTTSWGTGRYELGQATTDHGAAQRLLEDFQRAFAAGRRSQRIETATIMRGLLNGNT